MTDLAPGQYSIRSILILITAAAGLSALAAWLGRDWSILFLSLFIALANYLGMLAMFQRPRFAQVALYIAFGVFVTSFFLPTYVDIRSITPPGSRGGPPMALQYLPGWRVWLGLFWTAPSRILNLWNFFSPPPHTSQYRVLTILVAPAILAPAAVNLTMFLVPVLAHRVVVGRLKWYHFLLVVSAAGAGAVPFGVGRLPFFHIGFYTWCAAVGVPVVVLRLSRWESITFAMIAIWFVGGCLILFWFLSN